MSDCEHKRRGMLQPELCLDCGINVEHEEIRTKAQKETAKAIFADIEEQSLKERTSGNLIIDPYEWKDLKKKFGVDG